MRIRSLLWLSLAAAICCGCSITVKTPANDSLNSTLWVRTAAEYRAASLQTYKTALQTIDRAVGDPGWTAALEQTGDCAALPPAVVMDIDETVLDNARYQAQTVLDGTGFDPDTWDAWVAARRAGAVPGAVDFINAMAARGVTVVYITNRACRPRADGADACPQKQDTLDNLRAVGIAQVAPENLMLKGERPEWGSEKQSRRAAVVGSYRVAMLFGDDLADFLPDVKANITPARRETLVRAYGGHWGTRWFILSNPVYGSWLQVLEAPTSQYLRGD